MILFGSLPSIYGRTIRDAKQAAKSAFEWATVLANFELPVTPTPPQVPPSQAPEPQMVAPELLRTVLNAAPTRVHTRTYDSALRVMSRRWKDADVFLLFNEGPKTIDRRSHWRQRAPLQRFGMRRREPSFARPARDPQPG